MDLNLHLPWPNLHKPFIALHVKHYGWSLGRGRHRQIFVVMLVWGKLFSDVSRHVAFYPEIPWPRERTSKGSA